MTVNIGVILGTPRTKALGRRIFTYLKQAMPSNDEVTFTWMDLKDYPLPFYDHDETPLSGERSALSQIETDWLTTLKAQDGYVILSPEYDHGITGVLKNALDYVGPEVDHKPVQIMTYSVYSDGGMLAAESMVNILRMLKMIVMPSPVLLWDADKNFDLNGQLLPTVENSEYFARRLQEGFDDIIFYSRVLKANPYPRRPE